MLNTVRKITLAGVLFYGTSLMADYIVGIADCQYDSNGGETAFVVKGTGKSTADGSVSHEYALRDFINAKYANETNRYCYDKEVGNMNSHILVYSFKKKSEANKKFSELINEYKLNENFHDTKKIFTITDYNQDDWE